MKNWNHLLLIMFLITPTVLRAQEENLRLFQINTNGEHIKAEAYVKPQRIKVNNHLYYYWIKAREIHFSQGGYEGNLLHGSYVSFYPNEQLKEQGRFYKGLKNGEWKKWHPNGAVAEISNWQKGMLNGEVLRFNETGGRIYKAHYKGNVLHGRELLFVQDTISSQRVYKRGVEKVKKVKAEKKRKFKKSGIQVMEEKTQEPESAEPKDRGRKASKK